MTINGLHLLGAIIVILAIYTFAHWLEWRAYDRERRSDRLVHRNMERIGGTR